jgi:hypothetical protein
MIRHEYPAAGVVEPAIARAGKSARGAPCSIIDAFGPADRAGAHLPEAARGNLGPWTDGARRLRVQLIRKLNR